MESEHIVKFETTLDHLTGEELGNALTFLNNMPEVLDAVYLQGIGKKNRPCVLLQVLCRKDASEKVAQAIFSQTHTLGLRHITLERLVLPRAIESLDVNGKILPAKRYELDGETYLRTEADALANLANANKKGMAALRKWSIIREK